MHTGPGIAALCGTTGRLVAASWTAVSGWLVALAAGGCMLDVVIVEPRADVFYSLLSTFAQFALTGILLRQTGRHHAWGKAGRAASFVGAGIVTALAVLVGTLLLVVPGIYLAARWLLVSPLIIGEGMTVSEAMRASWRRTAGSFLPLMAALALLFVPGFGGYLLVAMLAYPEYGPADPLAAAAGNLFLSAAMILGWCLAVAAHIVLGPQDQLSSPALEGDAATA
ncbi:glycerophosphoryl diester phosphodiesterase membrane domain-containing protein [Sphingomonas psychrotolerans]|uniref:Glycerophosphoryl diester phosphodiesterase membrane domain-containing protein n=1 Tax=Sphingomonas psychrotolerans TaxID=1327635 RepID=A0ABU3NAI3_9SPHN|nr:glycerophosphoryl diester phosphodiesterase membrane domain-containing protein [Sphingomonas psychrotolerans]MDT8760501.1 glycerophosphoryl diester phosphodiesterase membrane domain-containing protein [Sphingomonas psychrotolerans]